MTEPRVTLAEFARALGVDATRECQYCGGRGWMEGVGQAHHPSCDGECGKGLCPIPVQEVTGCPCKGEPIPLTLDEIVDAGLAKERWRCAQVADRQLGWSDKNMNRIASNIALEIYALPPREKASDA